MRLIPLTSLSDDIALVRRIVERIDGPVVLVAHAYAGAVGARVENDKVKALVYIAASAPEEGDASVEASHEKLLTQIPKMAPDKHGYIWMPHEAILKTFAPQTTADDKLRLEAIQRAINVACITEKVPAPSWKKKPTWYLIAEEDRMILEGTQRFMAERMKAAIRTAAADHIPSLTMPGPVVTIVLEAAQSTLAS